MKSPIFELNKSYNLKTNTGVERPDEPAAKFYPPTVTIESKPSTDVNIKGIELTVPPSKKIEKKVLITPAI